MGCKEDFVAKHRQRWMGFCAVLPVCIFLCGCDDLTGPANVPEFSQYDYKTDCSDQKPAWAVTSPGTITANGKTATVSWGAGPAQGTVEVTCADSTGTGSHKTSLTVNIVQVSITNTKITSGIVLDGGENGGDKIARTAGTGPGNNAGIEFNADISLAGDGADHITVGFAQVLSSIPPWLAGYPQDPRKREATFKQPFPWHDQDQNTTHPVWYTVVQGSTLVGFYNKKGTITTNDSPRTTWPLSNSSGAALETGISNRDYKMYICEWTRDARDIYTIRAEAKWSFYASYGIEVKDGETRRVAGKVDGSIDIPNPPTFTAVNTAARPSPISGLLSNQGTVPPNREWKP